MSVVGFVRKALAMGVDLETALKMGEAFEAEMPVYVPASPEKSKGAIRTERWRKGKASQSVTEASQSSQTVTERHQASPSVTERHDVTPLAPVHTRGEDNPSRLEVTGFAAAVAAEAREPGFDWPPGKAVDHAKLLVAAAASPKLDPAKQPGLVTTTGRLEAWRRDGASWEHDVVPIVTTLARKTGPPVNTWKFFDAAIAQSIADNRRALDIPAANGNRHERPDQPSAKLAGKISNLERSLRGAESAAARRAQ